MVEVCECCICLNNRKNSIHKLRCNHPLCFFCFQQLHPLICPLCRCVLEDHPFKEIEKMLERRNREYQEIIQKYEITEKSGKKIKFHNELWIFQNQKFDRDIIRNESTQNLCCLLGAAYYESRTTKFFEVIVMELTGRGLGIY